MRRRHLLGAGIGGAVLAAAPRGAHAELFAPPPDGALVYDVYRKDTLIGQHSIGFLDEGDGVVIRNLVSLAVKVAFIPVFSFKQRSRMLWRDGRAIALDAETNDNGEQTALTGRAVGEAFEVTGPSGAVLVPPNAFTVNEFWNQEMVVREAVIDTKTGEWQPLRVTEPEADTVNVGGKAVPATHYFIESPKQKGDLWYGEDGRCLRTLVQTRGEVLDFRLRA